MDFKVLAAVGFIVFALFNPNFTLSDLGGGGSKPVVTNELIQKPSTTIVDKYKTGLNSIADIVANDNKKSSSDKILMAMHFHYLGTLSINNPSVVKTTADVRAANKATGGAIFKELNVPETPGLNEAVDGLFVTVLGDDAVLLEDSKRKEMVDVLNGISYVILNGRL